MRGVGFITIITLSVLLNSCATQKRIKELFTNNPVAEINLIQKEDPVELNEEFISGTSDEVVSFEDSELFLMDAVFDSESGEMIATETLSAITVQARFRNVPERNGEVEIEFEITVPSPMQHPEWQIRFTPQITIADDISELDKIYFTGSKYRSEQLKAYKYYENFISSILPEDADFVKYYTKRKYLERFIERNIPDLALLKNDSTYISEYDFENFYGHFNIWAKDALDHYTRQRLIKRNIKKSNQAGFLYNNLRKKGFGIEDIRLDSLISSSTQDLRYTYIQNIPIKSNIRKIELELEGSIYIDGDEIYRMAEKPNLTFYVSSVSTLADQSTKYKKRILYRNMHKNIEANIHFNVGEYLFTPDLKENNTEIESIKNLVRNTIFDEQLHIDSIIINSSCSPEGNFFHNKDLSVKRANSLKDYLNRYIIDMKKELELNRKELIWISHNLDEEYNYGDAGENTIINKTELNTGFIKTRSVAEDWDYLISLLSNDTNIKDKDIINLLWQENDMDIRENILKNSPDYKYILDSLFPKLRRVQFDIYTHNNTILKDTIHTNEIDTIYMNAIEMIVEREYKEALEILRSYEDYNTAVVYTSLDMNLSALDILEKLSPSSQRDYLLALIYSRLSDEENALINLINSINQDKSMLWRGNLDPEISKIIKKYKL